MTLELEIRKIKEKLTELEEELFAIKDEIEEQLNEIKQE
jgi:hypothetical protein